MATYRIATPTNRYIQPDQLSATGFCESVFSKADAHGKVVGGNLRPVSDTRLDYTPNLGSDDLGHKSFM